jgi:HEAT repeat protein
VDRDKRVDELREKRDVEGLIDLLEHGDVKTQGWAASALGLLQDPRAVEPLLRRLRRIDLSTATEDEQLEWTTVASALGHVADAGSPAADELAQVLSQPDG